MRKKSENRNPAVCRLSETDGAALTIVLLVIGVVIVAALFVIEGYIQHVRDAKMTFDSEMVDEAEDCAIVQYLSDGAPAGGVTYYYDAAKKQCYNAANFTWRIGITGYGLSSAKMNSKGETGAVGVPNYGDDGGAQILAIAVKNSGNTVHSRWQGDLLTDYDLTLMTEEELARLTVDQKQQVEYTRTHESWNMNN